MRRVSLTPREGYVEKVSALGLTFHTVDGAPYWNEAAAYEFERGEIETLETATNELHEMCLAAVEALIQEGQLGRLGIPEAAQPVIARAWELDPPAIYGRFDLCYDGTHPPKMLEYNADTPTSLLEAAVVQWHWLQDLNPALDQFNSIWEGLVGKWTSLRAEGYMKSNRVHFASIDAPEDLMTTAVMMDTAREAGLDLQYLALRDIGWDHDAACFVDAQFEPIETLFKLYPWEWMLRDSFGTHALQTYGQLQWIEPIWKMVLSNKAILAVLWEMFPDHPNLLPAYLDGPRDMISFVTKPILGREGANVSIVTPGETLQNPGPYGAEGNVYQGYAPLPTFDGIHVVIGSWVIDGEARGVGIRESDTPITEDLARFVPHFFGGKL